MKIKMLIHIAGTRNAVRWPQPGTVIDLPDGEAADLCAQGFAVAVEPPRVEKSEPEKRPARKAEKRG